jgi:GT2 family glycosyltransferase
LENLTNPLADPQVAGVGGTYRTLNDESALARFIGLEIEFRYHQVEGRIDCHGTYSLAVRRELLERLGGFNEGFRTSAEDWDFTYRLSANHLLVFNRRAVVGHFHPEKLAKYLAVQHVRAWDRMRLYRKHPAKTSGDSYTEKAIGRRLMASTLAPFSLLPLLWVGPSIPLLLIPIFLMLAGLDGRLFAYLWRKRGPFAFYGLTVQYLRNFAWLSGIARFYASGGGLKAGRNRRLESGS